MTDLRVKSAKETHRRIWRVESCEATLRTGDPACELPRVKGN